MDAAPDLAPMDAPARPRHGRCPEPTADASPDAPEDARADLAARDATDDVDDAGDDRPREAATD